MKTPEQMAAQVIDENYEDQGAPFDYPATENLDYLLRHGEVGAEGVEALMIAAIEADRAQRDLDIIELIAQTLEQRYRPAAADRVRDDGQEVYDQYVGPMIDQIEEDQN